MTGQDIIESMNYVNLKFIDEAQNYQNKRRTAAIKWSAAAAACLVICVAVIGNLQQDREISLETSPEQTEKIELITRKEPSASAAPIPDYVNFSDIELPKSEREIDFAANGSIDIAPFEEKYLSDCTSIVEGRVTNIYTKHYEYDVYDDKFEADGVLHQTCDTVVYEIDVDRTWYGEDVSGTTIKVEDTEYYRSSGICGEAFEIRRGVRYVIPIYEYGEKIHLYRNKASGDDHRDSTLATLYPFHPQIVVTENGEYIVSSDWPTLTKENAVPIVIEDNDWYNDKMYLIDHASFHRQMETLIKNIG